MTRHAFRGDEDPVDLDDDLAGALKELLENEVGEGDSETVEPVLDE
jgi:hypothetical protein